jgi:hypothetical protein
MPKDKVADRAQTRAACLLKVKSARAARDKFAKTIESEKAQLAGMVAGRTSLPRDNESIRRHLDAVAELQLLLEIDEAALVRARAALDEAEAEAATAELRDARQQIGEEIEQFGPQFNEQYTRVVQTLANLFRSAIDLEAECARLNSAGALDAPALRAPLMFEEGDRASASLKIELSDATGRILWRGNGLSSAASNFPVA